MSPPWPTIPAAEKQPLQSLWSWYWGRQRMGLSGLRGIFALRHASVISSFLNFHTFKMLEKLTFHSSQFYTIFTLFISLHCSTILYVHLSRHFFSSQIILFHSWHKWRFFFHVPFISAQGQFLLNCSLLSKYAEALKSFAVLAVSQVGKEPLTKTSKTRHFKLVQTSKTASQTAAYTPAVRAVASVAPTWLRHATWNGKRKQHPPTISA